jgi:hypothetical protein
MTKHKIKGHIQIDITRIKIYKFVGTLSKGYVRNVPLPRVARVQTTQSHQATKIPDYYKDGYLVPTYNNPRRIVERAALAFSPAWQALAINK